MSDVDVSKDGPVTHILLNRPASHNALTPDMHHDLEAAFNGFARDSEAMIAVVTGVGDRAFCAGSDLKFDVLDMRYPDHGYAGLAQRFDLAKPVIAAVNGYALGGGFELALACDIIIAADTASFGLPEPLAGMDALGGGLHRLARQIGLKQAGALILTSSTVSAVAGHRLGFVNDVVPPEDLGSAVARCCADILRASPAAIRASKQAMMRGLDEPSVAQALAHQASHPEFARWRDSEDAREGPCAFAQKRPPHWTS